MPALAVVPDLDELKHGAAGLGPRLEHAVAEQLLRQRGEELSTTALSQQSPTRLMLAVKSAAASRRWYA